MNHKNISKEKLSHIIYGLRKTLNLSHSDLSRILDSHRCTILRWELKRKQPKQSSVRKILAFIEENKFNLNEITNIGSRCIEGYSKDMKKPNLNLSYNEELAELVGIILGDGEITKEGIRISFDPKKDRDFLFRRVFVLIDKLLGAKVKYESYKRIVVYNKSFVRFLKEDCNFDQGSKSNSNISIPEWCFNKEEYLSAILRGLFDTDGYFGYCKGSVEVMYGRFSDKCTNLVLGIEKAMKLLELNPTTKHTKDGRYRIRLSNKRAVINFFDIVGTSNLKHIVRFLLWRTAGYEAKIEVEGMTKLIRKCNFILSEDVSKIELPYFWKNNFSYKHLNFIPEDEIFIKTRIKKAKNI